MSIYIVMRDEDICGVFTTPNSATRQAEAIGGRWSEYELDPQLPAKVIDGYNFYHIRLYREGTIYGQIECLDYRDNEAGYRIDTFFGHSDHRWWKLIVNVWGKTPEDALEYAQRIRQELVDSGKWERAESPSC